MRMAFRAVVSALALGGVAGGFAVHAETVAAATAPTLSASNSAPVAGERVTFTGQLTTRFARPVYLQIRTTQGWKNLRRAQTAATGAFAIASVVPAGTHTFRVYATATSRAAPQVTQHLKLTMGTATGSLDFFPAPVAQSVAGTTNLTTTVARFSPPVPGRAVVLQRATDGVWSTIGTGTQDSSGAVTFLAPVAVGDTRLYRAVAKATTVVPRVSTPILRPTQWSRVFNDNFVGTALDPSKWSHRQVGLRVPSRTCAENSPDMVSVSSGAARLRAKRIPDDLRERPVEECPHGEFYNAAISTMHGKFDFRYGVLAARMKFGASGGQHGALWSQPTRTGAQIPGDPQASGAEIDAVEYFGDGAPPAGGLAHGIWWRNIDSVLTWSGIRPNPAALLQQGRDWSDDYHVYSVEWTPTQYIFRIDGTETFRTDKGVSGIDQYVILSQLTNNFELPRMTTSTPEPMSVDWVRVWQG